MMRTRSATKRVESGESCGSGAKITENPPVQDPHNLPTSPAKKRRRTETASPKKRRRGKPGELCQLNLDVLFLIAAYIHPIDLLNLARTCKSLRQLLMDKSSTFVWKTARSQINGLPDCPADLTEPEYANLMFYARCYGCAKYAPTILWQMRRRYCVDCKISRLCTLVSCPEVVRRNDVLGCDRATIESETTLWVDREQLEWFMDAYNLSSDKEQFLKDKRGQQNILSKHASQCERWKKAKSSARCQELRWRREERDNSIVERLKKLGFEAEFEYFGFREIQLSCKRHFRKSKPLTDKEWNRIQPELLETMNNFRSQRLEDNVYPHRWRILWSEYGKYVTCPPPGASSLKLLPRDDAVDCFSPFRDIIRAPEGTEVNQKSFEPAFVQLPELADDWLKKLDVEVAELIKIPSHLSNGTHDTPVAASISATGAESSPAAMDRFRLACAMFRGDPLGFFAYPEVFSACTQRNTRPREGSISERYGIKYIEEAPYVIHACGLDPHVATADDMDCTDVQLICLSCERSRAWRWRDAIWHAHCYHTGKAESINWQVKSGTEATPEVVLEPGWSRCLLCLPRVGDGYDFHFNCIQHLKDKHHIEKVDIQEGVHYAFVGMVPRRYHDHSSAFNKGR